MNEVEEIGRKYGFWPRSSPTPAEKIADKYLGRIYAEAPVVSLRFLMDAAVNEVLDWAARQCEVAIMEATNFNDCTPIQARAQCASAIRAGKVRT